MRIILDPQIFNDQKYGGISRYYTEIFSNLKLRSDISIVLPIFNSNNVYITNSNLLEKKNKFKSSMFKFLNFLGVSTRYRNRKEAEKLLKKTLFESSFDLFVPTYYSTYFIEFIEGKPFVLTVYDMIHELFPQYFINDSYMVSKNKIILMQKATMIIAVSENTKRDILKIYPQIDELKIKVVYHGSSIKVNDSITVDLPEKYILFVGSRDNYKNFKFLLESIHELLKKDSNLMLICAGGGKFNKTEIDFINHYGLENQVKQKFFEEEQLGLFYRNAQCFVFPSAYEGFGIPVLESMACGCPVVLANHSSFPEIAGEAGVYFDLESKIDLKDKIQLLLENENIRKEFAAKGLEQIKKFNWQDAAEQCLAVYKEAINKHTSN